MDTDTAAALALDADEAELAALELRALLPALRGAKHDRYAALDQAIDDGGRVPAELVPVLESVLDLTLRTGRARGLYLAEGERILTGLLRRTPRGRQLAADLADVNQALRILTGHPLDSVNVRMRTIGHYTITLQSPAATLTLAIHPNGARLESLTPGPPPESTP
ncbi:MAG: hypothetical protein ACRD0K_29155 [Egibacteraceae bacterium]